MQESAFGTFNAEVATDSIRREELDGRPHLVAPVVAVRSMVLKGEYLPPEEIEASAPAWNGRPLPVNHPTEDGEYVTANTPERLAELSVGSFFGAEASEVEPGTNAETTALLGELWVDIEKSKRLGGEAAAPLTILASHAPEGMDLGGAAATANADGDDAAMLEVSTAYFYQPDDRVGTHNGEDYDRIQRNVQPDHLALLPNDTGECSVEDGCGAPRVHVHHADAAPDAPATHKSKAGVTFTGTSGGKLDESALDPDEHTLSDHYLYGSGENKEDFGYPVVDAAGNLRRGNVESAWELGCRGKCTSDETHRRKLRSLADEFDGLDFSDNSTGATSGTAQTAFNDYTESPMHDDEIAWLAEHSAFDAEALEGMSEDTFASLKETVEATHDHDDCNCTDTGDGAGAANDGGDGTDGDGDGDAPTDDGAVNVELPAEVTDTLETLSERVESIESRFDAQEQAERDQYVETITAHSDRFSEDDLSDLDTATLEGLAADYGRQAPADYGGRIGAATNGSGEDTEWAENMAARLAGTAEAGGDD